jgi:hypothetical protein
LPAESASSSAAVVSFPAMLVSWSSAATVSFPALPVSSVSNSWVSGGATGAEIGAGVSNMSLASQGLHAQQHHNK